MIQLVCEYAYGKPEICEKLGTDAVLDAVAKKLLLHKGERRKLAQFAALADMFELLVCLAKEPERLVGRGPPAEALLLFAHRRGLPLSIRQAQALLAATPRRAHKKGPQALLAARIAEVFGEFGVKAEMVPKWLRARRAPIKDKISLRSPERFDRALQDGPPGPAELIAMLMMTLGYSREQVSSALVASGHHPEEVQYACIACGAESLEMQREAGAPTAVPPTSPGSPTATSI